jgi:NAD(P)-dependent dehydrogenase (short-subunit alcohol dehydrogenase family)
MPATHNLKDQTVLVIGRGSGLARAVVRAARDAGARVIDRDLTTDEVGPSRQP